MGEEATPEERAAIESAVPEAVEVLRPGRVVLSGSAARSLRHLLLPALAAVQSEIGWVSPGALNEISRRLLVPPAEAYGVATFYSLISTVERPRRMAHICDDIACRQAGGLEMLAALDSRDDVHSSPCLGQCDRRPVVLVQRTGEEDLVLVDATTEGVRAALDGDGLVEPPGYDPAPQTAGRRVLAGVGRVDPESLDSYRSLGGYRGLEAAMAMGPRRVIEEVKLSKVRGRGGAAFPTGVKWEAVANESGGPKYAVCNADESEPGTFKDRVLIEGDPFAVIESTTIAGYAVGASMGYIYLRGEYPLAARRLSGAISQARAAGLLGENVMGAGFTFDLELRTGGGAYICGEETALFNSIEGYRGEPRQKPPFPVQAGLFGKPTVINNVETLVNVLDVVTGGGAAFAGRGTPESTGTRLFCLSGDVGRPGIYEAEFGATLQDLITMAGGVVGELRAVLLGGAAGSFVGPEHLGLSLTFEATRAAGVSLGSGVIMIFNHDRDMRAVVHRIARFFRDESCGQCVPCRVGTQRVVEILGRTGPPDGTLLDEIDRAMKDASICGLGQTAATAVRSALASGLIG
jgi:NADH-quinone oxidoreductase subunit F